MDQRQFDKDMALFANNSKAKRRKKMGYIYLASPYSAKLPNGEVDRERQEHRFRQVMGVVAHFMNKGYHIYSPILHCHELAVHHKLPGDFEFWKEYNKAMIEFADEFWILEIDGWKESKGIAGELEYCRKINMDVFSVIQDGDEWVVTDTRLED